MRVRGTVVSFVGDKGYGFIRDRDNQSYYFNTRDVLGDQPGMIGRVVEFQPVPTPRGMAARKVSLVPIMGQRACLPSELIVSSNSTPKRGEVVVAGDYRTREGRSLDVLNQEFADLCIWLGGNAWLERVYSKYTASEASDGRRPGVHHFTMHVLCGRPAVVCEYKDCEDSEFIRKSHEKLKYITDRFSRLIAEDELRTALASKQHASRHPRTVRFAALSGVAAAALAFIIYRLTEFKFDALIFFWAAAAILLISIINLYKKHLEASDLEYLNYLHPRPPRDFDPGLAFDERPKEDR